MSTFAFEFDDAKHVLLPRLYLGGGLRIGGAAADDDELVININLMAMRA